MAPGNTALSVMTTWCRCVWTVSASTSAAVSGRTTPPTDSVCSEVAVPSAPGPAVTVVDDEVKAGVRGTKWGRRRHQARRPPMPLIVFESRRTCWRDAGAEDAAPVASNLCTPLGPRTVASRRAHGHFANARPTIGPSDAMRWRCRHRRTRRLLRGQRAGGQSGGGKEGMEIRTAGHSRRRMGKEEETARRQDSEREGKQENSNHVFQSTNR